MKRAIVSLLFLPWLFSTGAGFAEVKVIENPAPLYHGTEDAKTLRLVKSIEEIQNDKLRAFAGVLSVATDRHGNYYIFDYKHGTIVKLDKQFKFLHTIGGRGEGPGEFKVFQAPILLALAVGLDDKLYYSSAMNRKIIVYTLDGKFIAVHRVEHFKPFKAVADDKGNLYLHSLNDRVIDVFDKSMKLKKSLISNETRSTFLFFKPPACVVHNQRIPNDSYLKYTLLSNKDLLLVNNLDLSVIIADSSSGEVKKKFYLWDDYILDEYRKKLKRALDSGKEMSACSYNAAFTGFFTDECDNIYLGFVDSKYDHLIYTFSLTGELVEICRVDYPGAAGLRFFQYKDNNYYAYSPYGIHIFRRE